MMKGKRLANIPPMGWNSWNTFFDKIDENLVLSVADAMVAEGLRDAGYEYLIVDDCWSKKERDADGNLVPDPVKFPHGLGPVIEYVHEKGLKFGIYSCCGVRTCAGYPGSFEHEFADAKQFARWGVDYLKYDNCFRPNTQNSPLLYRRMSAALRSSGRDILLAACQWGTEDVHRWIRSTGAHTFRSTVDIQDAWQSIASIANSQMEKQCCQGPGCFNDMDMLVVGMYGKGLNPETSIGGCTDEEYQTHFALWSMMNSPLIIGCDVREMSEETKKILLNPDLIAINQDLECRSCDRISVYGNPDAFVLVKVLSDGDFALGFFNFSDIPANVTLNFWDMGLMSSAGCSLQFYDCLEHRELGRQKECYVPTVAAHGCKVYRCSLCMEDTV
jgi:alpha-galactosidase